MNYLSFIICCFTISFVKAQVKIDYMIAQYENMEQLESLYKQHGTMLIVNNYVYKMPCDCYCRGRGGNSEDRNLGGNTENRELGGSTENRTLLGDVEDRNLGGDKEDRSLGGDSEDRDLGGNMENRNLAGNTEDRNLDGYEEERELGGNIEDRFSGGNTENRDIGGDKEDRNMSGQVSSFTCHKDESGNFFLSGINPDAKLQLYDGIYLEEIMSNNIRL